jgi:hypothetical protein
MPGPFDGLYCTDEDVALRGVGDYAQLAPRFQSVAAGADGSILATDRWVLASGTCPFLATGLAPGHVIILNSGPAYIGPSGRQLYGVVETTDTTVRLRNLGEDSTVPGMPPPAGSGIEFTAPTIRGQIRQACNDLNSDWSIRSPEDLVTPDDLRRAAVLLTYARLLQMQAPGKDNQDAWIAKWRLLQKEWDMVQEILARTYGAAVGQDAVIVPMGDIQLDLLPTPARVGPRRLSHDVNAPYADSPFPWPWNPF